MTKFATVFCIKCLFTSLLCWISLVEAREEKIQGFEPEFRVLLSAEVTTLDPQQSSLYVDQEISSYLFDPLFTLNEGEPEPILVEAYEWQAPTRWVFTLKKGVLFHNGSELSSEDVVATFDRAFRLKNNAHRHLQGNSITALDTYRFQIDTELPNSELLWDLEDIYVIQHSAEQANKEGFDEPRQLIGTGPYLLVKQKGGRQFTMKAFMDYHRGPAYIRNVHLRSEPDSSKRVAAFLRGDADLIGSLADDQLKPLMDTANITNLVSNGLYMINLDINRSPSPEIRDYNGKPMTANPLKDLRVRQAISKALDREAIINTHYGLDSATQAAGQLVNDNINAASPTLKPDKQDIAAARQLLKEAGYPKGFQITLRDRDSRRPQVELIATMLSDAGIQTQVETLPASEFFPRMNRGEFSATHFGYTTDGNLANMLKQLLYSGQGMNVGRYTNHELDRQIDKAMAQTSISRKRRELRKAQEIAIGDLALIPILFASNIWATRSDMVFKPTGQMFTEAYYVEPLLN